MKYTAKAGQKVTKIVTTYRQFSWLQGSFFGRDRIVRDKRNERTVKTNGFVLEADLEFAGNGNWLVNETVTYTVLDMTFKAPELASPLSVRDYVEVKYLVHKDWVS